MLIMPFFYYLWTVKMWYFCRWKKDCGFIGLNRKKCEDKGCCYRVSTDGTPWCFFPGSATKLETEKKEKLKRNETNHQSGKRRDWPKKK